MHGVNLIEYSLGYSPLSAIDAIVKVVAWSLLLLRCLARQEVQLAGVPPLMRRPMEAPSCRIAVACLAVWCCCSRTDGGQDCDEGPEQRGCWNQTVMHFAGSCYISSEVLAGVDTAKLDITQINTVHRWCILHSKHRSYDASTL